MSAAPVIRQSIASFRREREADWLAFEDLLARLERGSPRRLSQAELLSLPVLYRATLSSLSVARTASLDVNLVGYLEALSLRGYLALYGARGGFGPRLARFFARDWPRAVVDLWRETLLSLALMVVGIIAGWRLVAADSSWFGAIVGGMAEGRGPHASAAALRKMLYGTGDAGALTGFAAWLFQHNAQISILAFALGFMFGAPTVLLLIVNGCMLGAMLQVYFAKGLGLELVAWLSIHGSTELFAITLAGAAGLRIGTRIAFPRGETRIAAAARAGRVSARVMMGVVVMLLVAGGLEGIGRQTILDENVRLAIGGFMLLLWCGYFYVVGNARDAR